MPHDLTSNQADVLAALLREECPTVREAAESAHLSVTAARTAVMALVRYGLAEQLGTASTGGACYGITVEGRALLQRLTHR